MITVSCRQKISIKEEVLVDCSKLHLTYVPQKIPTSTTHLTLSHNRITNLTNGIFAKFKNFIYLDISNNLLKKLEVNSFNGLNKLQVLNISSNYLSGKDSFPKGVFKALSWSLDYGGEALKDLTTLKILKLDCLSSKFVTNSNVDLYY